MEDQDFHGNLLSAYAVNLLTHTDGQYTGSRSCDPGRKPQTVGLGVPSMASESNINGLSRKKMKRKSKPIMRESRK